MNSDVRLAKPALREYKAQRRQQQRQERRQEVTNREDYFLLTLRPTALRLFAELIGRGELECMHIKHVWWCRPRLVMRLQNQPYGWWGLKMCVWITSQGEVITRRKFWWGGAVGGPSGGVAFALPVGMRVIASFRKPRHLDLETQQAIYDDLMERMPVSLP